MSAENAKDQDAAGALHPPQSLAHPVSKNVEQRISSFLAEYSRHIRLERGLSPNTVSAYLSDLRQFFIHLIAHSRCIENFNHCSLADPFKSAQVLG